MIRIGILSLSLLLVGLGTVHGDEAAELAALKGDWRTVSLENDGQAGEVTAAASLRIRDNKVILLQDGKELDAEFTLKLETTTDPKLIDVTTPDGQTLEGIYKLEDKRWTICIRGDADIKDRPATFESKPGTKIILAVFEKVE